MGSGKTFLSTKKSSKQIICPRDGISLSMDYSQNVSLPIFLIVKTHEET
jgi:hypothetical protein